MDSGQMFLAWALLGGAIGALAGFKRGFSPVVGLVAGAVLGILAPVLFGVSGLVRRGDLSTRKCPHCAEFVKPEAKICKHCHQPLASE